MSDRKGYPADREEGAATRSVVTVKVKTTGCRVNQADEVILLEKARGLGLEVVTDGEPADIVVVNACAVTGAAERDARSAAYRALREGARKVFLTGCFANRLSWSDEAWPGRPCEVEVVSELGGRTALIEVLAREVESLSSRDGRGGAGSCESLLKARLPGHPRSRPLVKVQEGCDRGCTYCIVPLVRGKARSVPLDQVKRDVLKAWRGGAAEIVVTGTDLASWGEDLGDEDGLVGLLQGLLALGTGARFRLTSLEPDGIGEKLIQMLAAEPDLCRHVHVAVQSGSQRVLRSMGRQSPSADMVLDRLWTLRRRVPGVCLGADLISGFPTETESDFEATLEFVRRSPLDYLHVFRYSPRPRTPAFSMGDPVPHSEKVRRSAALRSLGLRRRIERLQGLVGRSVECVDIGGNKSGAGQMCLGDDYTKVMRTGPPIAGRYEVRILELDRGAMACIGEVR